MSADDLVSRLRRELCMGHQLEAADAIEARDAEIERWRGIALVLARESHRVDALGFLTETQRIVVQNALERE